MWAWAGRHAGLLAGAVPALVLPALVLLYLPGVIPATPSVADMRKVRLERPTVVLSADGKELAEFKRAHREWVKLADISPNVVAAVIATEDRRFFEHHGIDPRRIAAAALQTVQGDLQGGSTITQQLARNLYPDEIGRAPTILRKVKEALTAVKIEDAYGKEEILETYLNTVPFLYNTYGIEMAARTYFDKPARELNVLQSATLIGMLKGTTHYNPVLNPERALQRRNTVMAQMVRHGQLAAAAFESLKNQPLGLNFERQGEFVGPAPHAAQQLRRWLIDWADRNSYNLYTDGLVVRTTIDSRLQAMANEALARQSDKLQAIADKTWGKAARGRNRELARSFVRETPEYRGALDAGATDGEALKKLESDAAFMNALWQGKTRLQSGFVALDPASGHVLAWVGSRGFDEEKFDHVQQARRQPGSTFKPFVYGAAFEQGIDPADILVDQPVEIPLADGTVWQPSDMSAPSGLAMSLRQGLIHSKNTITAQLVQRIGPARVAQVARAMGVRQSKLDVVPSLALGTSPVTLKEMVSGFASIANGGNYIEPVLVTRIENRNHMPLQQFQARPEPALSNAAAQTLLDVMRGVIDQGTGTGIRRRFGIQADVAGKTGTTQDNTDGWFILMHPQLVAGAWVGFNDNRVTMKGDWGQGAHNALNIVGDFFRQALQSRLIDPKLRFDAPRQQDLADPMVGRMSDWFNRLFQGAPESQRYFQAPSDPAMASAAPSKIQPGATRRIESLPRIVIVPDGSLRVELPEQRGGHSRDPASGG
ncbi:MAG TPA: transglycosylase domain-containing protein [Ramlibacter sp.]|nr:transglycosylase domain-containing protein [Ramlibacter sp.]